MPHFRRRARTWTFRSVDGEIAVQLQARLVRGGAGIGIVSGYLREKDIADGRLIRLLPDWFLAPVPVSLLFPSRRELAPAVRSLADFLDEIASQTPWGAPSGESINHIAAAGP